MTRVEETRLPRSLGSDFGERRHRPRVRLCVTGLAAVRTSLRGEYQRGDLRGHRVRIDAAVLCPRDRSAGAAAGERRIYVNGLLVVAVSTAACAFADTYWQLLLSGRSAGSDRRCSSSPALGLMIRISPQDARGRVAGMFSSVPRRFGCRAGAGNLTVGLGLSAPFVIYGAALLIAAAIVFISLRRSSLAAPAAEDEVRVTVREALRHRAYRAALLSSFATGWSVFGLRMALVPLFVTEDCIAGRGWPERHSPLSPPATSPR